MRRADKQYAEVAILDLRNEKVSCPSYQRASLRDTRVHARSPTRTDSNPGASRRDPGGRHRPSWPRPAHPPRCCDAIGRLQAGLRADSPDGCEERVARVSRWRCSCGSGSCLRLAGSWVIRLAPPGLPPGPPRCVLSGEPRVPFRGVGRRERLPAASGASGPPPCSLPGTRPRGGGRAPRPAPRPSRGAVVFRFPARGLAAPSRATPAVSPAEQPSENEAVAPEFTNRNPRNLELLAVARKERGWSTVWPSREFWHRLRVVRTQHHIEGIVEHWNGQVVVSASTQEWAIKKHLYSTRNVVACESIGRVLAQRCLEAGINFMVFQPTPWEAASDSITRLQNAMIEGGVVLREPRRIYE
ncbi:large ribosomal subunit protein uL18m [Thomomys bottae]